MRLSGPRAVELAGRLVGNPARIATLSPRRLSLVALIDRDGAPLDEALCAVMRAPDTYTGEDVVELSCHGSPAVLRTVVARLCDEGARLAEPGEFTRRAFLNGRMNLARAEAVALLVAARTARAARLAARAVRRFGEDVSRVREELVDVIAGLEVRLDFPEEGVGLMEVEATARVRRLAHAVEGWEHAASRGRIVHEGLTIVLVGAPNAGKSTLMNALVGRERAIVSPNPGTTRDVVEATIAVAGVPVRLLDTAGLGAPRDAIEAEGMRRTRKAIAESDLAVVVLDGSVPPDEDVLAVTAGHERLLVRAKADLPRHPAHPAAGDRLAVCALDGSGLDGLRTRLEEFVAALAGADGDEGELVVSLRQREILVALVAALDRAAGSAVGAPVELALVDLRGALSLVSELLGVGVGDAVLDRVFSTFCLGK